MRTVIVILAAIQFALLYYPFKAAFYNKTAMAQTSAGYSTFQLSDKTGGASGTPYPANSPGNETADNTEDNSTDESTDNSTDNSIPTPPDNETDNETEDNETIIRLNELFASVTDNYSCVRPQDTVIIPWGTRLENCIRNNLPNHRWPMTCEEAARLTSLACSDPEISSLDGLQQFPNLKIIDLGLQGTKISDLAPIRNLTALESLSVPYSEITEIGFLARLNKLRRLDLKGNSVTNLEFMPFLSGLEVLYLEYQGPEYVTDIFYLSPLTKLTILSLQGNKITDLTPLSGLRSLAYLSVRDNRITDLTPLSELSRLTVLNFSINLISDLSPIDNLSSLSAIYANSNRLSDITVLASFENLREIEILGNSVSDISPVSELKKLKKLAADYNEITDVSPLIKLAPYNELRELGLSYNCVSEENYGRVPYLKRIETLRLDHQCENFPENIYPDNQTVVNGDLVNAKDTLALDNITLTPFEATAGRGCSAISHGSSKDVGLLLPFLFLIIRRALLKITRNENRPAKRG